MTALREPDSLPMPAEAPVAETIALGTAMVSAEGLAALLSLTADDFTPGRHRAVFEAIRDLASRDVPVTSVTMLDALGPRDGVGPFLLSLDQAAVPAPALSYFLDQIAAASESRRLLRTGQMLTQLSTMEPGDTRHEAVLAAIAEVTNRPAASAAERFIDGASFVLDAPDGIPAVWGRGTEVLWAEGEALMICGPSGVGKTTIAGQLVAGRLGLMPTVLGYPVAPGERNVLYLAMDRPRQAARALRRILTPSLRHVLAERLVIWPGPPPHDFAKRTDALLAMCERANADTVIVDSLKDAALGLSDDEVGAGYNRARQRVIRAGIEVIELHHQRKAGANGGPPNTIADVYGSVWLPNGAGSVIALHGSPGDPLVQLLHLKQPAEPVGPLQVLHDHHAGLSSVHHHVDLLVLVRRSPAGLTAKAAACAMFDTDKPGQGDVEKARRKLDGLVRSNYLVRKDGQRGGSPAAYYDAGAIELEMARG